MTPLRRNAIRFACWRLQRQNPTMSLAELSEATCTHVNEIRTAGINTHGALRKPTSHGVQIANLSVDHISPSQLRHYFRPEELGVV
jgi:hypothetical protein